MLLLNLSLSASILIILIVIIRTVALYKLPKVIFIGFWSVVLARLYLPFYIEVSLPKNLFFNYIGAEKIVSHAGVKNALYIVWLVGVVAVLGVFLVTHFLARKEYCCSLPIENEALAKEINLYLGRQKFTVRQTDRIDTPLTYGTFKPVILLPSATDWSDDEKLRYIILHELTHIRRFDILVKWLLVIAVSVYWFNPLIWVMYVLFNRDMELYCDEGVIEQLAFHEKAPYAKTLVNMEKFKLGAPSVISSFRGSSLNERVTAIMKNKPKTIGTLFIFLTIIASLVLIGFAANNNAKVLSTVNDDFPIYVSATEPETAEEGRDYEVYYELVK